MSTTIDNKSKINFQALHYASLLDSSQRKKIGIESLGGYAKISHIARHNSVSRKFVYAQKDKAVNAIEEAFCEQKNDDRQPLFYLPVSKEWMRQLILSLVLVCRSSYRGVVELLRDLFDYSISVGTIHNIVFEALEKADKINGEQDLSQVRVGVHDEIFQSNEPVLVGCDADSTYCYLLSHEASRDGNTWGVNLLDLSQHQGLSPNHTVADGGQGLRKGQKEAWPEISCYGDVFHALKPLGDLVRYLDNRAFAAMTTEQFIKKKLNRPRRLGKANHAKRQSLFKKLSCVENECQKAISLADDARTLYQWLKDDILALVGPETNDRQEVFNFLVDELRSRESMYSHKIRPVRIFLENNRDNLLKFAKQLDKNLTEIAEEHRINLPDVREVYQLQGLPFSSQRRWEREAMLKNRLEHKFHVVESRVKSAMGNVVRASSIVENLNSRLRNYFSLRKQIGENYLTILQFFLNHRRFMRSQREERTGKSPKELLTGEEHGHWLELLGFELFKRAA